MIAIAMPRHLLSHALCSLTLLVATAAAQAGPMNANGNGAAVGACAVSDLGNSLANDCLGYASGNDSQAALASLVGINQWHGLTLATLSQFKDDSVAQGSTNALFDVQQSAGDASQGRLTFLQSLNGPFVLTLKGGNTWAAYHLPQGGVAGSSISFDIPGEQGRGLSHASIYTASVPTPAAPVPEPPALALVLLAISGLAASAWQRRRRQPA